MPFRIYKLVAKICTSLSLFVTSFAFASGVDVCGSLHNAYGPFDYTDPIHRQEYLPIVERAHFTADVETLKRGSRGTLTGDLDYVLRAFPNHHRALFAMSKYQLKNQRPPKARYYSATCYFERAMKFRPTDGTVRLIYGIYLHKAGKSDQALVRYKEAEKLSPDSAEVQYNLGLLFFDLKQYEQSNIHAQKAYELKYPLKGLKNKLQQAGAWKLIKETQ